MPVSYTHLDVYKRQTYNSVCQMIIPLLSSKIKETIVNQSLLTATYNAEQLTTFLFSHQSLNDRENVTQRNTLV